MSRAGNGRRLGRLEQSEGGETSLGAWMETVEEMAREQQAALILAKFAQELAGTEERRAALHAASRREAVTETAVPVGPPRLPQSHGRVWSDVVRPGPHDVLTWEEAMRVPWLDGSARIGR